MKLLIINAIWSPIFKITNKNIKEISKIFPDLKIIEYGYEYDSENIKYYNIGEMLPVLILLDEQGFEKGRLVGEKSVDEIKEFIIKKS